MLLFQTVGYAGGGPDSLRQALQAAAGSDRELPALTELASYYALRNHDSTLILCRDGLALAREWKDPASEVNLLLTSGYWYHNKGQYPRAKAYYFSALTVAESEPLPRQLPAIYNNLGITYQREFRQDSAYYFLSRAERAYEDEGAPYAIWKTHKALFEFFAEKGDTSSATAYARKAFSRVEREGDRMDRGFLLFTLLHYFFRTGQFESMAAFQEKWEQYQLERKNNRALMETPEHIAIYMFGRDDDDQTEQRLREATVYFEVAGNPYRAGFCYEDLGHFYLREGKRARAEVAFQSALMQYRVSGAGYRRGKVLYQLYQFHKEEGRPGEALAYLESYKALSDSLAGVEVEENLNELRVRYETSQKEQALRIQRLELDQKTQQRNLLLGSSVMLALLAGGIFFGLRQRLRANRRLAEQEARLQTQRIQQLEQEKRLSTLNAMLEGQEKERVRIANDLHDSLGGVLASAKSYAAAGQKSNETDTPAAQTARLLTEAGVELRRITQDLAPRSLSVLGLSGAVEDLAGRLREEGIECRLQILGLDEPLPSTTEVMLFRIVQELTHNIRKHAAAEKVLLQLFRWEDQLLLIVEDDGRGFDLAAARQRQSLGLASLASRVRFLGGELDIDTAPGRGAAVTVQIPLPEVA